MVLLDSIVEVACSQNLAPIECSESPERFFDYADVAAKLSYHQSPQRNLGRRIQKHVRLSLCQFQPRVALAIRHDISLAMRMSMIATTTPSGCFGPTP